MRGDWERDTLNLADGRLRSSDKLGMNSCPVMFSSVLESGGADKGLLPGQLHEGLSDRHSGLGVLPSWPPCVPTAIKLRTDVTQSLSWAITEGLSDRH